MSQQMGWSEAGLPTKQRGEAGCRNAELPLCTSNQRLCLQVNMELDKHGVALRSYFPRRLLRGRPHRHLAMRKGHDYTLDASCALPTPPFIEDSSSSSSSSDSLVLQPPPRNVLTKTGMVWQPDQSLIAASGAVEDTSEAAALQTAVHGDAEWLKSNSAESVSAEHEEEELLAVTA